MFFGSNWGSIFGQIWCQLGPILDPKTFPKGGQVGSKIDPSWGVDLGFAFEWILGQFLLIFLLERDMAEVPKSTQKHKDF